MLLRDDVEACVGLAQELQDRGVVLEPKIGPLGFLVSELSVATSISNSVNADSDEAIKNYIPELVSLLHETTSSVTRVEDTSLLDTSSHDLKLEEFSDLIAQGVTATIHCAKAVVIPAIKRIEDAISDRLKDYEDRNIANIGIDEIGLGAVLDNDQVFDYFAQYKDLSKITLRNANLFPALDDASIARLVEAGDPEINEHLQATLMNTTSSGSLGSFVYNQFYRGDRYNDATVEPYELRNIIKSIFGDSVGVEGMMLAYYIGKGLLENLPEGVAGGLRDVEHRVNLLTRTLGLMIYSELDRHRKDVQERKLFPIGLPYVDRNTGEVNAKYSIRVNKEVYADYLANGGSPEAVYGAMVSDRCVDPQLLIANKAKYEDEYTKFVSLNRSYTTSSKLDLYKDAIRDEFYCMVADTEELKQFDTASGVFVRLLNALKRMGADQIACPDNTYRFLRGMLCSVFYPDRPEIEKVISDLDEFSCREGEENLSTAEIANIVLVDLIVDWLCDQITVRKV